MGLEEFKVLAVDVHKGAGNGPRGEDGCEWGIGGGRGDGGRKRDIALGLSGVCAWWWWWVGRRGLVDSSAGRVGWHGSRPTRRFQHIATLAVGIKAVNIGTITVVGAAAVGWWDRDLVLGDLGEVLLVQEENGRDGEQGRGSAQSADRMGDPG